MHLLSVLLYSSLCVYACACVFGELRLWHLVSFTVSRSICAAIVFHSNSYKNIGEQKKIAYSQHIVCVCVCVCGATAEDRPWPFYFRGVKINMRQLDARHIYAIHISTAALMRVYNMKCACVFFFSVDLMVYRPCCLTLANTYAKTQAHAFNHHGNFAKHTYQKFASAWLNVFFSHSVCRSACWLWLTE